MSSSTPYRQHKSRQRERSAKRSAPQSRSGELSRSGGVSEHLGYTENVTSQRSWREKDASAKTSPRPRLSRDQPRSGSETFSPLEAPKLQQETVYSSNERQHFQGTPKKMAKLAVTSNSRIGSEVSNQSRDSYHPGESPHSGGLPNHLNNSPHHPSDTQTPPRSQGEHPTHVYPNFYRSADARLHPNLRKVVQLDPGPFRSGNARAPSQPQRGAPSYSNPIPQCPSNLQGQPAQQEQFHEGRRQGQSIPPQLVSAAADSIPLPQKLNFRTPHGTRPPTTEQAQQITIEGIRPSRERDLNRNPYPDPEFPPDLRDGDQSRGRPPLQEVARGQKQAGSNKSSISGAHSSDLGGLDSCESSQSSSPRDDRRRSSSQREFVKSNYPWKHSFPGDWKNPKSRQIRDSSLLGKVLEHAGYVDAMTSKGLVRKPEPRSKFKNNNSKGRGDRKSNHKSDHRKWHDNHSSEQFDDESVEGQPLPGSPHQFDTRPHRSTRQ
ncbi:uncharacterized protein EAE97_010302 [Botrytis byssoidea]|uniref:Uncharacterized protein n=1 Tax=Botrytis byssoidea TaxID=139641 RepID=A0A9P5I5H0_9HELO|nr:uncharacterized protein EAE97_010302 [Botrytis byssoidea]KAF7926002.1 hypothetical protein EAE97_010302 [Botrytis byssoidea]